MRARFLCRRLLCGRAHGAVIMAGLAVIGLTMRGMAALALLKLLENILAVSRRSA
jgi:hypothetical protein